MNLARSITAYALGLLFTTQAIATEAGNWSAAKDYFMQAQAYANDGKHLEAVKAYTEGIRHMPKHSQSYEARAEQLVKLGEQYIADGKDEKGQKAFRQAKKDLSRALDLNPHAIRAFSLRGKAHQLLDDHEGAIADFTSALKIYPKMAECLLARATSYRALDQEQKAREDLDRLTETNPDRARELAEEWGLVGEEDVETKAAEE